MEWHVNGDSPFTDVLMCGVGFEDHPHAASPGVSPWIVAMPAAPEEMMMMMMSK